MWVVLSSKGGVGKSVIAKNLLIPYVVKKYNQAFYINTNDTNDEHKLVKAKNFSVETTRITNKEIEKLDPLPYAVLDAGAGRNTVEVLKALTKFERFNDVKIVIVLSKRLLEINEAVKTYKYARKLGFSKIVPVFNRVSDFQNYKGEFSVYPSELFGNAEENSVLFPYDEKEILGNLEDLERRLPYDIYLETDDFISQYREKLKRKELTQEDRIKRKFYGFLRDIFREILSERNLNILSAVDC